MKHFTSIHDVDDVASLLSLAQELKEQPFRYQDEGRNKTLGLFFMNPSLRTRLSTQKAAQNLGMQVIVMNLNNEGWAIEFEDGTVMNENTQEHIKEASGVLSQYCDIIGIRTFPGLKDRDADYSEIILNKLMQYTSVPVLSLESATLHPLQSFADLITIQEYSSMALLSPDRLKEEPSHTNSSTHRPFDKLRVNQAQGKPSSGSARPKVVLTWAPHPRALPQAVPNSFAQWMLKGEVDLVIANPEGFDLSGTFTYGAVVTHDQDAALANADFVYAKNWSSYKNYGAIGMGLDDWMITPEKMRLTNEGKFMHCLPVRRNVVVADEVLDSKSSLVLQQANNRTYAAQAVLLKMLRHG